MVVWVCREAIKCFNFCPRLPRASHKKTIRVDARSIHEDDKNVSLQSVEIGIIWVSSFITESLENAGASTERSQRLHGHSQSYRAVRASFDEVTASSDASPG